MSDADMHEYDEEHHDEEHHDDEHHDDDEGFEHQADMAMDGEDNLGYVTATGAQMARDLERQEKRGKIKKKRGATKETFGQKAKKGLLTFLFKSAVYGGAIGTLSYMHAAATGHENLKWPLIGGSLMFAAWSTLPVLTDLAGKAKGRLAGLFKGGYFKDRIDGPVFAAYTKAFILCGVMAVGTHGDTYEKWAKSGLDWSGDRIEDAGNFIQRGLGMDSEEQPADNAVKSELEATPAVPAP